MNSSEENEDSSVNRGTSRNRSRNVSLTNVNGLSEQADKVLVRHLTSSNPDSIKLDQLVKSRPDIFESYVQSKNYQKIRNRYNYLRGIRATKPQVFISLCVNYRIILSEESLRNILNTIGISLTPDRTSSETFQSREAFVSPPRFSSPQVTRNTTPAEITPPTMSNMKGHHLFESAEKKAKAVDDWLGSGKFVRQ